MISSTKDIVLAPSSEKSSTSAIEVAGSADGGQLFSSWCSYPPTRLHAVLTRNTTIRVSHNRVHLNNFCTKICSPVKENRHFGAIFASIFKIKKSEWSRQQVNTTAWTTIRVNVTGLPPIRVILRFALAACFMLECSLKTSFDFQRSRTIFHLSQLQWLYLTETVRTLT
jgi:hypothetical protein